MRNIRRYSRPVTQAGSITVIRTNGLKGSVHIFVHPHHIKPKPVIRVAPPSAIGMPEYRKNPRTRFVFPPSESVVARKSRRPNVTVARRQGSRREAPSKVTAYTKLQIQPGFHYTEKRVIKELDDVLKSETAARAPKKKQQSVRIDPRASRSIETLTKVQKPSTSSRVRKDQICIEQGRRVTEGTVTSAPADIDLERVTPLHEFNVKQLGLDRTVLSVPDCVRSLKRHYHRVRPVYYSDGEEQRETRGVGKSQEGEWTVVDQGEGASVEVGNESEIDDLQEQLKFKMEYWNKSIRRELPLPYLRMQDKVKGRSISRRNPVKNTVSRMTAFVTKKKAFGEIPDADGTPISPGDCVWISKPYLSIAIYIGKRSIVRCLATEIVKELVDPFQTIWKAKFTGGDAYILPKDRVLATAKRRIGEIYVGTNMEFIVNCLTNLESLEAYEAGFRLLDEKGSETNFHMAELY